jgi:hypothetical protein
MLPSYPTEAETFALLKSKREIWNQKTFTSCTSFRRDVVCPEDTLVELVFSCINKCSCEDEYPEYGKVVKNISIDKRLLIRDDYNQLVVSQFEFLNACYLSCADCTSYVYYQISSAKELTETKFNGKGG